MWTHKSETAPNLSIRRPVNNPFTILFRLFFLFYTTIYTHTLHQGLHTVRLHIGSFYHFPQKNENKKKVFPSWAHCVSAYAPLWLTDLKKRKKTFGVVVVCVVPFFFGPCLFIFSLIIIKLHFASIYALDNWKKKIHFILFYFLSLSLLKRIQFHPHPDAFSSFLTSKLNCEILYDSADVYNTI